MTADYKLYSKDSGGTPKVQRWQQPSHPPKVCHFSAISRTSRRHKMSIQRLAPVFPPAISADKLQNMHKLRILCILCSKISNSLPLPVLLPSPVTMGEGPGLGVFGGSTVFIGSS